MAEPLKSWVRYVPPQIVEVAVPVRACGIVSLATEQPEIAVQVHPMCRTSAAARFPDFVMGIGAREAAVNAVRIACVGALGPNPRARLSGSGIGRVDP